jgi:hypothetical protein
LCVEGGFQQIFETTLTLAFANTNFSHRPPHSVALVTKISDQFKMRRNVYSWSLAPKMHELRQRHCRLRGYLSEHVLICINTKRAALYLTDKVPRHCAGSVGTQANDFPGPGA